MCSGKPTSAYTLPHYSNGDIFCSILHLKKLGFLQEVTPFHAPIRREGKYLPLPTRISGGSVRFSRNDVVETVQVIVGENRRSCFVNPRGRHGIFSARSATCRMTKQARCRPKTLLEGSLGRSAAVEPAVCQTAHHGMQYSQRACRVLHTRREDALREVAKVIHAFRDAPIPGEHTKDDEPA